MAAFSFDDYTAFVLSLPQHFPEVRSAALYVYSKSSRSAIVRGSVFLQNGLELRVLEYLDTTDGELLSYGYTVLQNGEKVRWYDPHPHPELPELKATFPHHRHEPPDIKHRRLPAPGISFTAPNLPTLIADCIELGKSLGVS